jgi:nitroimidazol reductase NimA-like FMN-containing flavoprotein (pyridoxamine 5'-phosphate oxidase superfamily)
MPLSSNEIRFLDSHEVCRIATVSMEKDEAIPHVTPVVFMLDDAKKSVLVVVDYGTKKLANLRRNPNVSLVVDDYNRSGNAAVVLWGRAEILEKGEEYRRLLKMLFQRFDFYRQNPWKEGEAPIIRISPSKTVSWGITQDTKTRRVKPS